MVNSFKVNNFDLIRIFAATQVLVHHTLWHLQIKIPYLTMILNPFPGVTIFFFVSGYLISAAYERTNNLKMYVQNRLLRIYPGLIVCVFVTVIALSFLGFNFFNTQTILWLPCQMVGLIYTPKFLSQFGFGSYNGSLWTIPVELQFYFVLPVVYFFLKSIKQKNAGFFLVFLGFFITGLIILLKYRVVFGLDAANKEPIKLTLLRYSFIPKFFIFLFGVLMQRLNAYKSQFIAGKGLVWLVIYLLFSFFAPDLPILYLLGILLLCVCVLSMAYSLPYLANKLLKGNDISYGVYIYHGLVVGILVQLKMLYKWEYLFVVILVSYMLGYMSSILIERPFMKKKKHTIHPVPV